MIPGAHPIRVLIVDDSATVRKELADLLAKDPEIELVGTAMDPYIAREKILKLNPDVLVLDLGLPRMDGLTFLKLIMQHRPMPVIIASGLVEPGSDQAIEALELGAFDVVLKPEGALSTSGLHELPAKIRQAGRFSPHRMAPPAAPKPAPAVKPAAPAARREFTASTDPRTVILFGASTGGTEALKDVLTALPGGLPGMLIVQHIPPKFSKSFADRLNTQCAFEVREASDGDLVHPGLALIAPGGFHMELRRVDGVYKVALHQGPELHHQRPAVDVLFDSAAGTAGKHAIASLLTGMGRDGATGLKHLRDAGAVTFAQDEATSVVFGMPQAAIALGAAQAVLPLDGFPDAILRALHGRTAPAPALVPA